MNFGFSILLAFAQSLAGAIGGEKGVLARAILNTAALFKNASDDVKAKVLPWIQWANGIIDSERNPTEDERAAYHAWADAIRAQNHQLAQNVPVESLPPLPLPPGYSTDATGNIIQPDGRVLGYEDDTAKTNDPAQSGT